MSSLSRKGINIAVCTVCVAGVAAGAWFGALSPRISEAASLTDQTVSVRSATTAQQAQLHKLQDMAAHSEADAARAQELFASMPKQADLPEVLDAISAAASRAGIGAAGVQSITPGVPIPLQAVASNSAPTDAAAAAAAQALGVHIAKLDLSVTVVGTRDQLLEFIDQLDGLDRAFLVNGTVLTSSPTGDAQESLNVTGTMFVLQSFLPDLVEQVRLLVAATEQR